MYYIYRITNLVNGKTYIGQHKYKKLNDNYMGSGVLILKAIEKYGKESFDKEILYSSIQYKETADDVERFAIKKERALGKAEYNIADGGQGGNFGDEVNKKRAEARRGQHHSDETKRKLSESAKGRPSHNKGKKLRPLSEEAKKKISEASKRHRHSDETKEKISKSRRGEKNPMYGKPAPNKGQHWYNNGKVNMYCYECPEGFVPGMLK